MSAELLDPSACRTMTDVRAGVDALDRQIVTLLGQRLRYMEAAARIKTARSAVRDEPRKAQVIANAIDVGKSVGVPADLVEQLYEQLVEYSIAYELARFDRLHQ